MQTTVFHLIGSPGVGKYTIGKELAALTGARLVDNHSINNVLFNLLDGDGIKPLPRAIWPHVLEVRRIVLDTIMHVSPPHLSFIFTNYIRGEDQVEYALFLENVAVAEVRNSTFIPVVLTCDTEELMNRIGSQSRKDRLKLLDPVLGRQLNELPRFTTDHPNLLELDVTNTPPGESARRIAAWAEDR
jgi:hypothetical protein